MLRTDTLCSLGSTTAAHPQRTTPNLDAPLQTVLAGGSAARNVAFLVQSSSVATSRQASIALFRSPCQDGHLDAVHGSLTG